MRWPGSSSGASRCCSGAILAVGMFPQISVVSPLYLLLRELHLINTYPGLVLPYLTFAMPLTVWLLVGFFRQLPGELEEAAMVDGAGRLRAFWEVIVPLARARDRDDGDPDVRVQLERVPLRAVVHAGPGAPDRAGGHRALPGTVSGPLGPDSGCRRRRHAPGDAAGARVPAPHRAGAHRRRGERLTMASVRLEGVDKTYPNGHVAAKGLDLEIRDGEFMVLVGPSGCGKSTALRMIAGLETPTGGRILIGDRDVTVASAAGPRHRHGLSDLRACIPHMTVGENLAFGLRMRGTPVEVIEARVKEAARALGLEAVLTRRPAQLSGGQRQRVALGRAIVREPKVFLFDEPLSNLDAKLRVETRAELARLHRRLGATVVYVTHDQEEAMTLGWRVASCATVSSSRWHRRWSCIGGRPTGSWRSSSGRRG